MFLNGSFAKDGYAPRIFVKKNYLSITENVNEQFILETAMSSCLCEEQLNLHFLCYL